MRARTHTALRSAAIESDLVVRLVDSGVHALPASNLGLGGSNDLQMAAVLRGGESISVHPEASTMAIRLPTLTAF